MEIRQHDLVIIGGGPAGLAAAIAAKEAGCKDLLLIERDRFLGGILNQCIHDGFGLHRFQEALSGPEYAIRDIDRLHELGISVMQNSMVLSLSKDKVLRVSRYGEYEEIRARAVILAMGCRERTRGALSIPGHRPSGIYTAGAAQNLVNMENTMPGRRVCILGSGDIGLIMARRMTLEGAKVEGVFEILPYSSGLSRNIRQCLDDYDIPLYLNTTVIETIGEGRLEAIRVAQVDANRVPIMETSRLIDCDTLLLSVGLIPENELSQEAGVPLDAVTSGAIVDDHCMTEVEGIFACGNVLHVHDLVDYVSREGARAGVAAAQYVMEENQAVPLTLSVTAGHGVRYVMPQKIRWGHNTSFAFRVNEPYKEKTVQLLSGNRVLKEEPHARLHPAEMLWIELKDLDLGELENVEVRVL